MQQLKPTVQLWTVLHTITAVSRSCRATVISPSRSPDESTAVLVKGCCCGCMVACYLLLVEWYLTPRPLEPTPLVINWCVCPIPYQTIYQNIAKHIRMTESTETTECTYSYGFSGLNGYGYCELHTIRQGTHNTSYILMHPLAPPHVRDGNGSKSPTAYNRCGHQIPLDTSLQGASMGGISSRN